MSISMIGLDTAKSVFQIHGVNKTGKVEIKRKLRRSELIAFFEKQESCTVVMEACGAAHHWARMLTGLGHTVKLIAAEAVKQAGLELSPDRLRQLGHKRDQIGLVLLHLPDPGGKDLEGLSDRRRSGLLGGGCKDVRQHLRLRLVGRQQLIQDRQDGLLNLPLLRQLLCDHAHGVGYVGQASPVYRRWHHTSVVPRHMRTAT